MLDIMQGNGEQWLRSGRIIEIMLQSQNTKVLITGATGYVGSHVTKLLSQQGYKTIVVDRNVNTRIYTVEQLTNTVFYEMSYGDTEKMQTVFESEKPDVVIHLAANSLVGPSVTAPSKYYENNVAGTLALLDNCVDEHVKKFIFASSAACYGEVESGICTIEDGNTPTNPYGWTKRIAEIMLNDYATAYGINSVSLRFFNVAGADSTGELGQVKSATHIIARIMESAMEDKMFTLYGNDYPTDDGTCVRDYIHVEDVASGIESGLDYLTTHKGAHVFNLGCDQGYSNLDILNAITEHTPLEPKFQYSERRAGDPATLVADVETTFKELNWKATHGLDSIV